MRHRDSKVDKNSIHKSFTSGLGLMSDDEESINQRAQSVNSGSQMALDFDNSLNSKLIELVSGRDAAALQTYFDSDPEYLVSRVSLMQIYNKDGLSLLHLAVFKKYSGGVEAVLLNQIRESCKDTDRVNKYLVAHTKNQDGHTPLHLAVFIGNFQAIRFLLQEGADPQVASKNSLSYLHVGAQGDQPYSFYLKQRYNLTSKSG